jgi:hypothetical protein
MAKDVRAFGRDLYATFGTHQLHTDFLNVSTNEDGQLVDLSAGSDTYSYWKFLRESTTVDLECWFSGDGPGSALRAATDPGDQGTLTIAPLGTASTKPSSRAILRWSATGASTIHSTMAAGCVCNSK